jgi:hypothetical protein
VRNAGHREKEAEARSRGMIEPADCDASGARRRRGEEEMGEVEIFPASRMHTSCSRGNKCRSAAAPRGRSWGRIQVWAAILVALHALAVTLGGGLDGHALIRGQRARATSACAGISAHDDVVARGVVLGLSRLRGGGGNKKKGGGDGKVTPALARKKRAGAATVVEQGNKTGGGGGGKKKTGEAILSRKERARLAALVKQQKRKVGGEVPQGNVTPPHQQQQREQQQHSRVEDGDTEVVEEKRGEAASRAEERDQVKKESPGSLGDDRGGARGTETGGQEEVWKKGTAEDVLKEVCGGSDAPEEEACEAIGEQRVEVEAHDVSSDAFATRNACRGNQVGEGVEGDEAGEVREQVVKDEDEAASHGRCGLQDSEPGGEQSTPPPPPPPPPTTTTTATATPREQQVEASSDRSHESDTGGKQQKKPQQEEQADKEKGMKVESPYEVGDYEEDDQGPAAAAAAAAGSGDCYLPSVVTWTMHTCEPERASLYNKAVQFCRGSRMSRMGSCFKHGVEAVEGVRERVERCRGNIAHEMVRIAAVCLYGADSGSVPRYMPREGAVGGEEQVEREGRGEGGEGRNLSQESTRKSMGQWRASVAKGYESVVALASKARQVLPAWMGGRRVEYRGMPSVVTWLDQGRRRVQTEEEKQADEFCVDDDDNAAAAASDAECTASTESCIIEGAHQQQTARYLPSVVTWHHYTCEAPKPSFGQRLTRCVRQAEDAVQGCVARVEASAKACLIGAAGQGQACMGRADKGARRARRGMRVCMGGGRIEYRGMPSVVTWLDQRGGHVLGGEEEVIVVVEEGEEEDCADAPVIEDSKEGGPIVGQEAEVAVECHAGENVQEEGDCEGRSFESLPSVVTWHQKKGKLSMSWMLEGLLRRTTAAVKRLAGDAESSVGACFGSAKSAAERGGERVMGCVEEGKGRMRRGMRMCVGGRRVEYRSLPSVVTWLDQRGGHVLGGEEDDDVENEGEVVRLVDVADKQIEGDEEEARAAFEAEVEEKMR